MSSNNERRLESKGITILYEDEEVLVLNKPAPFLVLPDRFDAELPNLFTILNSLYGKMFTVHRLDKETSGVILFAKNLEAHAMLSEQFMNHTIQKTYHAIVLGTPSNHNGLIELPIGEGSHGKMRVDWNGGKPSVTRFEVLEQFQGYAYVAAMPKTGRTHQIRVHLSAIGLPIVCDELYGGGSSFLLSSIKPHFKVAGEEERPMLHRTALHATTISVIHPATNEEVSYTAPLPKDMATTLKYLRKFKQ